MANLRIMFFGGNLIIPLAIDNVGYEPVEIERPKEALTAEFANLGPEAVMLSDNGGFRLEPGEQLSIEFPLPRKWIAKVPKPPEPSLLELFWGELDEKYPESYPEWED